MHLLGLQRLYKILYENNILFDPYSNPEGLVRQVPLLIIFLFFFLVPSMWDLISLTRVGTRTPAVQAQSLNHWTDREVHHYSYFTDGATEIHRGQEICPRSEN